MYDINHDIIEKSWYHIWYHSLPIPCANDIVPKSMISYMISYMILKKLWYHTQYHIQYHTWPIPCAIFMAYHGRYHIHFLWICPWYHYYGISYLILRMIYANDIIITGYHSHTISHLLWSWYHSLCHGTCAAGWRWLGAPGARCSTGSSVQLNCDGLDAVHGPVALAAAREMHCGRFVVIKKSRLAAAAAAGCAAHAGKAPMHSLSARLGWHWGFKYGFGVQDGFKLETGEEGEAGRRECRRQ